MRVAGLAVSGVERHMLALAPTSHLSRGAQLEPAGTCARRCRARRRSGRVILSDRWGPKTLALCLEASGLRILPQQLVPRSALGCGATAWRSAICVSRLLQVSDCSCCRWMPNLLLTLH